MSNDFSKEEKQGLYKAIYTRRDVRSHFTAEPINDKKLAKILHAAHHAPSVGFSQPWNFILVKSSKTRHKIKESFEAERARSSDLIKDDTGRRSKYMSFKLEGIMESALNLCVTYDPTKFGPFVIGRTSIPEAGLYSVCCAIQNLWLAARTEGIGVGWVSILSNRTLKEILHIPKHVVPVAYLCLGPVKGFERRPDLEESGWLPRLGLKDVTYFEQWDHTSPDPCWSEISEIIKSMNRPPEGC